MAGSVPMVSTIFVLLLRLVVTEMAPMVAEARTCESPSQRFKGTCLSKSNCAAVCQTEGFPGGYCRGISRQCVCTKPC